MTLDLLPNRMVFCWAILFHLIWQDSVEADRPKTGIVTKCQDIDPEGCVGVAKRGECVTNWRSARRDCPVACWQCLPEHDTELYLPISEEEKERRALYLEKEWGSLPVFNKRAEEGGAAVAKIKRAMMAKEVFARQHPDIVCPDKNSNCEFWSSIGECQARLPYMMENCPNSCLWTCELQSMYMECRDEILGRKRRLQEINREGVFWMGFLADANQKLEHYSNANENFYVTRGPTSQQWVLQIKNFLLDEELEAMRSIATEQLSGEGGESFMITKEKAHLSTMHYDLDQTIPSHVLTDFYYQGPKGYRRNEQFEIRRNFKSAGCGKPCFRKYPEILPKTMVPKLLTQVIHSLTSLNADGEPSMTPGFLASYLEAPMVFDFVEFNDFESFAKHHDFRLNDVWKGQGYRILTIYLSLDSTPPPLVWDMGFPDLDHAMIPLHANQLLIWPNVIPSNKTDDTSIWDRNPGMANEILAPTKKGGKHIGVFIHLRQLAYDAELPATCQT